MSKITISWNYEPETSHPHVFFRLYENGELAVDNIEVMTLSILMDEKPEGDYTYEATTVDKDNLLESRKSSAVTYVFQRPAAPTGLKISLG